MIITLVSDKIMRDQKYYVLIEHVVWWRGVWLLFQRQLHVSMRSEKLLRYNHLCYDMGILGNDLVKYILKTSCVLIIYDPNS